MLDPRLSTYRSQTMVSMLVFVAMGLFWFPFGGRDDKYFTFYPAHTLASKGEILNYSGDSVEQSSTLLMVLTVGLLEWLTGFETLPLAWAFGIAGGLLSILATGWLARRLDPRTHFAAMLMAAVTPYVSYWAFSAMETGWVPALAIVFVASAARFMETSSGWPLLVGAAFAYFTIRPESFLVASATVGAWMLLVSLDCAARDDRAALWTQLFKGVRVLVAVGCVVLAVTLARLWFFDAMFPQPVLAKTSKALSERIVDGFDYVIRWKQIGPLLGLGFLGAVESAFRGVRERTALRSLAALLVFAHLAFVIAAGGDWMEGGRFLVPILPFMAVMAANLLFHLLPQRGAFAGVALVVVLSAPATYRFARNRSLSLPLWEVVSSPPVHGVESYHLLETFNVDHRANLPAREALVEIVSLLAAGRPASERVWVLTGHAGEALDFGARAHPERFGVIDLHGLSDAYLSRTTLRDPTNTSAIILPREFFLEHFSELHAESAVPRPDVLFEMDNVDERKRTTERWSELGYPIIYRQEGEMYQGAGFRRNTRSQYKLIAVREDLLPLLQDRFPRVYRFGEP